MIAPASLSNAVVVEYEPQHKSPLIMIALENKKLLFGGRYLTLKQLDKQQKEALEQRLDDNSRGMIEYRCSDPLMHKKLLLEDGEIAGYIFYQKSREESLESMEKEYQKQLLSFPSRDRMPQRLDTVTILEGMPNLKKTDAECLDYILIDTVVVAEKFRRKGYGALLIRTALEDAQTKWPLIASARLAVTKENFKAMHLYEKLGFAPSEVQNDLHTMLGKIGYEKILR